MPSYEDATLPSYTPLNLIYAIVFICIIPTITEEILMRKIVLDGLKEVGEISAVFLGGFIFAIFHMSPMQTIYQFIVGCSFAYIVIKGGNYVVTMVAHFFNNLFIILNYYFFKITSYGEVLNVIIPIIAVACFVVGIIILNRKGKKLNGKIEREKLVEFLIGALVGVLICMSMWISALVK